MRGLRVGHSETREFWTEFRRSLLDRGLRGVRLAVSDGHAALVRTAFAQEDASASAAQWDEVARGLAKDFGPVAEVMTEAKDDVLAYMAHPKELWPMLASNNGLERLNRELKRRADVVQIFPNENTVVRLMGAILMEQHDEWQVSRKTASVKSLTGKDTKDDALLARIGGG